MKALQILQRQIVSCEQCPRLVAYRAEVGRVKRRAYRDWDYWSKPVPGFGDAQARVLIVGLAPGAHGSNRTGRMFTGDRSGDILYKVLHKTGFASLAASAHKGIRGFACQLLQAPSSPDVTGPSTAAFLPYVAILPFSTRRPIERIAALRDSILR